MTRKGKKNTAWQPLSEDVTDAVDDLFAEIYPESEYGRLAEDISDYWIERLESVWRDKPKRIKNKDLSFQPDDPLSRVPPRTVVIAYPDSIHRKNEPTLETLDQFLEMYFPCVGGLHILPACRIAEGRFNDGYFSQVERNRIHEPFGDNDTFSRLTESRFSMADFVLNHVDIDNPWFQAFLEGDDDAGKRFYVYSGSSYRKLAASGAFDAVFRPRPFPLFTVFRRQPADELFARMDMEEKCAAVNDILAPDHLDPTIIGILSIFEKIRNDQVLLDEDYTHIPPFRKYLKQQGLDPDNIFRLSEIQETTNPPYIFASHIRSIPDLLIAAGIPVPDAGRIGSTYETYDQAVFGETVHVLTTFSHVQADVNTQTFEGLSMLADDFAWYLGLDLNMLRLDAADYAFKKPYTSCFGLPEVKKLMKILYLSMVCVSPRIVANLEVNDRLSAVLSRMSDRDAAPPMMYDFHLPCVLPLVFNTGNTRILERIGKLIRQYNTPETSIRFSVAETHDGKSVRGSMDLLDFSERASLAETVMQNGGRIKYKKTPAGQCSPEEFFAVCRDAGLDFRKTADRLFDVPWGESSGDSSAGKSYAGDSSPHSESGAQLILKEEIRTKEELAERINAHLGDGATSTMVDLLAEKLINGREPYELCCSTREAMIRLGDETLEAKRFLSFYTLAFALMGRNVRSIYFNDMAGLANDLHRMRQTGEYRDIKRTRCSWEDLTKKLADPENIHGIIAGGIRQLIEIADADPSLHPRGKEAGVVSQRNPAIAVVSNRAGIAESLVVVNTTARNQAADIPFGRETAESYSSGAGTDSGSGLNSGWADRFSGEVFFPHEKSLRVSLPPFGRLWLNPV